MTSINEEPTYNLKAVVRETGLKPDTLRAWERRYGLPQPHRTDGGHRIYSQQDIETLKWLVARQQEGLSISRAVSMWQQLEAEGKNPITAMASVPANSAVSQPSSPIIAGPSIVDLRKAWLSACLSFDEQSAERTLNLAFALFAPETVFFELIQPALAKIGRGWSEDQVTVHQEHFASALALRRLETLLAATPAPTRPGRLITGCPADEEHVFGPLLLTLLLRRQGRDVVYLGPNVPADRLETTIATTTPRLVILITQHLLGAANLQKTGVLLQSLEVPMAYGGQIFNFVPDLRHRIPGHFLGEHLNLAADSVEQFLISTPPISNIDPASASSTKALIAFEQRQAQIEAELRRIIDTDHLPARSLNLNKANRTLAQHLIAALSLGDVAFIGDHPSHLKAILGSPALSTKHLRVYLRAYRQAVHSQLGAGGKALTTWLDHILTNGGKEDTGN